MNPDERRFIPPANISPEERRRQLQIARDAQEQEANAADELAQRQQDIGTHQEPMAGHSTTMRNAQARAQDLTTQIEQVDRELQRLNQPLPIGAERGGDTSGQQGAIQAQLATLTARRDQLHQLRQTALDAHQTAQVAWNRAQEGYYEASAGAYMPEREVAESRRAQTNVYDTLAPPPGPGQSSPSSNDTPNGSLPPHGNRDNGAGVRRQ